MKYKAQQKLCIASSSYICPQMFYPARNSFTLHSTTTKNLSFLLSYPLHCEGVHGIHVHAETTSDTIFRSLLFIGLILKFLHYIEGLSCIQSPSDFQHSAHKCQRELQNGPRKHQNSSNDHQKLSCTIFKLPMFI